MYLSCFLLINIFFPIGKMIGMVSSRKKLHSVKLVLGDWQSSYRRCRKDEVVLCRARIGHTQLSYSYILKKDPPPQCILTVRHILVVNLFFLKKRKNKFGKRNVMESFRFHPTLLLLYLKECNFIINFNLYNKF